MPEGMPGDLRELKLMGSVRRQRTSSSHCVSIGSDAVSPRRGRWWAFWRRPQPTAASAESDSAIRSPADRRRLDFVDALHAWVSTGGSPAERSHLLAVLMKEYSDVPGDARQVLRSRPHFTSNRSQRRLSVESEAVCRLLASASSSVLTSLCCPLNKGAEDGHCVRSRNATSRQWLAARPKGHPFAATPVFLARRLRHRLAVLPVDLARLRVRHVPRRAHRAARGTRPREMLDRYELYSYKQWLRVYMRSKTIKHNKDLFESLDDPLALLQKLQIH